MRKPSVNKTTMISVCNIGRRALAMLHCNHSNLIRVYFSSSIVPSVSPWKNVQEEDLPPCRVLSKTEVEHLESISLVQYKNSAVEKARLEEMIRFADTLQLIDTDNVKPMPYVYEDTCLYLRDDKVTDKCCAKSILKNAKVVEEDYFVAPPGNVTFYESKDDELDSKHTM